MCWFNAQVNITSKENGLLDIVVFISLWNYNWGKGSMEKPQWLDENSFCSMSGEYV